MAGKHIAIGCYGHHTSVTPADRDGIPISPLLAGDRPQSIGPLSGEHGDELPDVYTAADKKQLARYQEIFGRKGAFRDLDAFQSLKYNDTEQWESYKVIARSKNHLQQKLNYVLDGEKQFIPQYTRFEKVTTIAGAGTDKPIRDVKRLIETYGGSETEWQKRAGKVISDKYAFDLHWYECDDGIQQEVKLKNRSERKI